MRFIWVLFVLIVMSSVCASAEETKPNKEECVPNFTEDGGFFSGKTMRSYREFPKANKSKAFDNILSEVASMGYQIVTTNKEAGLISVSKANTSGQTTPSPMNIIIKDGATSGIKVEITRKTNAGTITSTDGVMEAFCKIYSAI